MANILIADDEPLVRTRLAEILRQRGHSIAEAQDGKEAQAMLIAGKFDGLITDLIMPNGHGFGLVEFGRAFSSDLVIVAMSSKGNPRFDYLTYAMECGADLGFHKDCSLQTILDSVEKLLSGERVPHRRKKQGPVLWPTHMLRADPAAPDYA